MNLRQGSQRKLDLIMNMKGVLSLLLGMMVCGGFTSCKNDNEGDFDPQAGSKRLIKIELIEEKYGMVEKEGPSVTYDFRYNEEGKICSITTAYEKYWSNTSFTYSKDRVVVINETPRFKKDTTYCVFNKENYIQSISGSNHLNDFDDSSWMCFFSYKDGYLTKMKYVWSWLEKEYIFEENYFYENGLLVGADMSDIPNNKFSYTQILNVGNLFLFPENIAIGGNYEYHLCGILGENTKYLPQRIEWKDDDYTRIKDYEYELDEDGYVKTAIVTHYNTYGKSTTIINYTYENAK